MIYDIKTYTVIVTPPKCGTTILHDVLCRLPNYWYILGPTTWEPMSKHTSFNEVTTNEIFIKRCVLMIRNPIDRMISMWKHRKWYDHYHGTLSDFIKNHNLSNNWYAPCTSYVKGATDILHQETLFKDCQEVLGISLDELLSRRMNKSNFDYIPTQEETSLLKETAETIYHEDLRAGKYEI